MKVVIKNHMFYVYDAHGEDTVKVYYKEFKCIANKCKNNWYRK